MKYPIQMLQCPQKNVNSNNLNYGTSGFYWWLQWDFSFLLSFVALSSLFAWPTEILTLK